MRNEQIAASIKQMIDSEARRLTQDDIQYREKFDGLVADLENELLYARELKEDFEKQGLTVNTIEAEGYLRAFLRVESLLEEYKNR